MKNTSVFIVISMLVMAAAITITEAAVSCPDVENNLKPCVPYLQTSGSQGTPPANCCAGVKSVKSVADSTGDRKGVCECMKGIATRVTGLNYELASKLPTQCGVSMSYTLNPNTDCSKV